MCTTQKKRPPSHVSLVFIRPVSFSMLSTVSPQRRQLHSDKLFQVSVNSLVSPAQPAGRIAVFFLLPLLSNSKARHWMAHRRGSTTGSLLLMMDGENCWKVPNKKKRVSNCWVHFFFLWKTCQIHHKTEATEMAKSDKNKCAAADLEAHQGRRHSCSSLLSIVG